MDDGSTGVLILIVWVLCAFGGGYIYQNKGGDYAVGFVFGLLLGVIGLIVVLIMQPTTQTPNAYVARRSLSVEGPYRECPHCKESMRKDASVCPHCQRDSAPWVKDTWGRYWVHVPSGDYYLDQGKGEWVKGEGPG